MSNVGQNITQNTYYHNDGNSPFDVNWGTYQYLLLKDIINNFVLNYVGDDKVINKVDRSEIIFHAKRGLQELHYDALREIVGFEIEVPDTLRVPLPHDFVSASKVAYVGDNGQLYPIPQNINSGTPISYLQDNSPRKNILMDHEDYAITATSVTEDNARRKGQNYPEPNTFDIGKRFGLDAATANSNGTYLINKDQGYVFFSSNLLDRNVVIEYVSDGMYGVDEDEIKIHKLAEDFMYKYLLSCVAKTKFNIQEYIVRRAQKEASASLRNTKIRLKSIKLSELTQVLRGRDKWIK
jgi:hypothetical protein